jgi:hypothetical protein
MNNNKSLRKAVKLVSLAVTLLVYVMNLDASMKRPLIIRPWDHSGSFFSMSSSWGNETNCTMFLTVAASTLNFEAMSSTLMGPWWLLDFPWYSWMISWMCSTFKAPWGSCLLPLGPGSDLDVLTFGSSLSYHCTMEAYNIGTSVRNHHAISILDMLTTQLLHTTIILFNSTVTGQCNLLLSFFYHIIT